MNQDIFNQAEALTFDDLLIVPGYSELLPSQVDVRTRLARDLYLNMPLMSAAMDTVTEAPMAIAMARAGGLGVIHRNMPVQAQAEEVNRVKCAESGRTVDDALSPAAATDSQGRLLVGAAVGVGDDLEMRVEALVHNGVDVVVVDTAHGHSAGVIRALERIRSNWKNLPLVAGNVVTAEGTEALIAAGADAVKVGVGSGSICTTRIIAGAGMPQMTAIYDCARAAHAKDVPIIADGGVKYSGDITKAIVAGADVVMLGSLLAGLDESPGALVEYEGRQFKQYRGMGSPGALQGFGRDRYASGQGKDGKLVPEGIEGIVPYRGNAQDYIYQLVGGLRSGMGYAGAASLRDLQTRTRLVRITNAGLVESHPHDVTITRAAPNYQARE